MFATASSAACRLTTAPSSVATTALAPTLTTFAAAASTRAPSLVPLWLALLPSLSLSPSASTLATASPTPRSLTPPPGSSFRLALVPTTPSTSVATRRSPIRCTSRKRPALLVPGNKNKNKKKKKKKKSSACCPLRGFF
eukprot:Mycagemm_TRINITY_DN10307_c2_g2::TRINITY_DN10307_c2_g2_i3::g.442::m.442 type:complete len:139 gc:universal TRINITY_DN10307_c2_g2_i3:476-60(-)